MDRPHGRTAIRNRVPRRLRRAEAAAARRRLRTPAQSGSPAATWNSRWRRSATASVPRTGFRATIRTMPEIVAHGRRPDVRACALCHYPNGKGRAENAPIAGYPVAYFIQQMNDFKSGNRKSADPRKANTNVMIAIAKAMTDEEIKADSRVLRIDDVDAVDQGGGDRHGAQDAHRGRPVPGARGRREGADRQAHYRSAGEHRSHRDVPRIRARASSPTRRRAASRRARRW